jgi:hypothetical protein
MLERWAVIVGLSMTPALVAGPSAACAAGIAWHIDARVLLPVIAASSFVEGVFVAWLAGGVTRAGLLARWLERLRNPRAITIAERYGAWGGLLLGVAVVGQEPVLVALRFLGVDMRKLWIPLALSNAVFALVYYEIVKLGWNQLSSVF